MLSGKDLVYLWTISNSFGGLRDVDVKAGEKVIITPATGAFGSAAAAAALGMGARVAAVGLNVEALERLRTFSSETRIRIVQNTGDVTADVMELTKDGPVDIFFDILPGKATKSTHFKSSIQALRRGARGKWMYTKQDMRVMIHLIGTGCLTLYEAGGIRTDSIYPLEQSDAALDAAATMRGLCSQAVIASRLQLA